MRELTIHGDTGKVNVSHVELDKETIHEWALEMQRRGEPDEERFWLIYRSFARFTMKHAANCGIPLKDAFFASAEFLWRCILAYDPKKATLGTIYFRALPFYYKDVRYFGGLGMSERAYRRKRKGVRNYDFFPMDDSILRDIVTDTLNLESVVVESRWIEEVRKVIAQKSLRWLKVFDLLVLEGQSQVKAAQQIEVSSRRLYQIRNDIREFLTEKMESGEIACPENLLQG